MTSPIEWNVIATDGRARAGMLRTRRGNIETPVFMPVGTQGAIKGVRFEWLENEFDARIILGNTYHLFLRPGVDVIREFGGLHGFNTWERPILTDSGGFQVFSLTQLRKLTEEGVEFRSHLDGGLRFISPEVSMEIQAVLGSEIVMAFDECPPGDADKAATKKSLDLTMRWAKRSKDRFGELQAAGDDLGRREAEGLSGDQALFGIVQGAGHLDLRSESLERIVEIGFDGYAIGGLSVGEEKDVMYGVLDHIGRQMPAGRPRYLMGVGTPEDLVEAVGCGIDMFDCVIPTRNGRTGSAFTSRGKINIRNAKFISDKGPIDEGCVCSVCKRYSLGYIRHLYQAGEMNARTMISHHNIAFFFQTMRLAREAIREMRFFAFKKEFLSKIGEFVEPSV